MNWRSRAARQPWGVGKSESIILEGTEKGCNSIMAAANTCVLGATAQATEMEEEARYTRRGFARSCEIPSKVPSCP
jgi:hypothetical protein